MQLLFTGHKISVYTFLLYKTSACLDAVRKIQVAYYKGCDSPAYSRDFCDVYLQKKVLFTYIQNDKMTRLFRW